MAMRWLTKPMFDQFVVVLNNSHRNYEIAHWRLDIDDDDNLLMTCKQLYANGSNDDGGLFAEGVPDRFESLRSVPYGDEDVGDDDVAGGP